MLTNEQRSLLVTLMHSIGMMGMATNYDGDTAISLTADHFAIESAGRAVCKEFQITQDEVVNGNREEI